MTYIAFLRAVNVGGRTVKMDRLREVFARLGFADIRTYIQSGNVFFKSAETDQNKLASLIEKAIEKEFGFETATIVRTVKQVQAALEQEPFKGIQADENTRLCVVFVNKALPSQWPVNSPNGDIQLLGGTDGEVFAVLRQQPGRALNPAAFIEKTYPDIKATSRFHHTLLKMMETAKQD